MINTDNIIFEHYELNEAELLEWDDEGNIIMWIRIEGLSNYKWN